MRESVIKQKSLFTVATDSKESSDLRFGLSLQGKNLILLLFGLGHNGGGELGPEFDVAGRAHEGGDSSVGSVGSSAAALGAVDLDVLDDQLIGLELLGVGVGFEVLDQTEQDLDRLFGPATLGDAEFGGLTGAGDVLVEADDGDAALVGEDVLEVALGDGEGLALEHLGGLVGVLEVNAQFGAAGLHRLLASRLSGVFLSHL